MEALVPFWELANPWCLPPEQARCVNALVDTGGTYKIMAAKLGKSPKTIEYHIHHARIRMGARTAIDAAIMWDRWLREREEA